MLLHLHWFTNAVLLRCSFISTTKGTDYKISTFFFCCWDYMAWLYMAFTAPFQVLCQSAWLSEFQGLIWSSNLNKQKQKNTLEVQKNWTRSASEQESSEQLFFFFFACELCGKQFKLPHSAEHLKKRGRVCGDASKVGSVCETRCIGLLAAHISFGWARLKWSLKLLISKRST